MSTNKIEESAKKKSIKMLNALLPSFDRKNMTNGIVAQMPEIHVIERDPKDNLIIACAVAVSADYIISRDLDLLDLVGLTHFFMSPYIISTAGGVSNLACEGICVSPAVYKQVEIGRATNESLNFLK